MIAPPNQHKTGYFYEHNFTGSRVPHPARLIVRHRSVQNSRGWMTQEYEATLRLQPDLRYIVAPHNKPLFLRVRIVEKSDNARHVATTQRQFPANQRRWVAGYRIADTLLGEFWNSFEFKADTLS